jgi:glutamyl-tRNA(Gln) amidotransferase subunit D
MKSNAKPGDLVEIHLTKLIYQGYLLESSESEKNIVLLKLENGYNIGFNKKDIHEIKKLKSSSEIPKSPEIKRDPEKPNIAMIITGGTIAARLNPKKGGVDWLDTPESLFKFYPGIFDKVNVSKVEIPFMKASEDMDFKDWKVIANTAEKLLNDSNIKGIVITHGTDFLHYTAAALSFMLKNLNKPVVLTFSQRSIDRASSDANLNLACAIQVATSDINKVTLVGHASEDDSFCNVMIGTKVRKMHTSRRDTFKPINTQPIARVWPDKIEMINTTYLNNKSKLKPKADTKFEEKVALVKIYPGQDPEILDYYVKQGYKGIILELGALGHAPTMRSRKPWTKKLKEIIKKGIIVCGTSQCIYGRTDPLVYSNGREILETGVIYLEDMLSETALVKLGWVLGHTQKSEEIKKLMLENISNEFNTRLEE